MFPKIVNILGILSLMLVLAAGGTAGYLAFKGTLNGESLKTAVAAVTSQPAAEDAAASQPAAASLQPGPAPASKLLAAGHASDAAAMGELEMWRRQVANEQSLVEGARLQVLREREKTEQQHKQWELSRQKDLETAQQSGAQKELEILASIKPAQALEVMRGKPDAEAARTLMAMETRKAKKIIELCKTTEEKDWRKRILELIRERNNVQAAALAGG